MALRFLFSLKSMDLPFEMRPQSRSMSGIHRSTINITDNATARRCKKITIVFVTVMERRIVLMPAMNNFRKTSIDALASLAVNLDALARNTIVSLI